MAAGFPSGRSQRLLRYHARSLDISHWCSSPVYLPGQQISRIVWPAAIKETFWKKQSVRKARVGAKGTCRVTLGSTTELALPIGDLTNPITPAHRALDFPRLPQCHRLAIQESNSQGESPSPGKTLKSKIAHDTVG